MSIYKSSSLAMIPTAYKDGKLYSVRPNDGAGDFTFSRGSNLAATRVDVNGLIEKGRENLYTQSNNFSHSDWNVKAGTFTQGVADPDGGNNAWSWTATNTDPYLYQSGKSTSGVSVLSIWVKGVGSTIGKNFELRVGSAPYKNVVLTGEWQRVEHYNNTASGTSIGFEYGNPAVAGDVVHIYQAQYEQGLVATDYIETGASTAQAGILEDMPRLDYSGGASCPALLLEPQRTNNIPHSEYFGSGSGWSYLNNVSVGNFVLSPEGKMNATELVFDGSANGRIERVISGLTSGADYSVSLYARVASGTQDVSFGSFESEVFTLTTEWQRLERTQPENDTNAYPRIGCNDAATIEIWGFQHEAGSYPTSYIPTYGSSVTRSHEGTLGIGSMQSKGLVSGAFSFMIDFKDIASGSPSGNFIYCYTSTGSTMFYVYAGSIGVHTPTGEQYLTFPEADGKFALVYDGTNVKFFKNGAKYASTYTASTRWADMDDFRLYLSGSTAKINYNQTLFFPTALTDSECIALTTL